MQIITGCECDGTDILIRLRQILLNEAKQVE